MKQHRKNILITIAARGGSKGLKGKNIRLLMGKPLIAYTVEQAVRWGRGADIICSTDSAEIARIARAYGAKTPFVRPDHLAGDKAGKVGVIRHALVESEKIFGKRYDIIVDLDVTAPIRRISDLDNCLKIFDRYNPKTLFSVVKSRKNPYFNMIEQKKDGRAVLCCKPKRAVLSRQKAPLVYDMNASIYFYARRYLLNKKNITAISDDSIAYIMDDLAGIDIDKKLDFDFVEYLIKKRMVAL